MAWMRGILRAAAFGAMLIAPLGAAWGEDDIIAQTAAAQEQLAKGHATLERARSAKDRVAALTQTIRAYEEGLAAIRVGLRQVTQRQSAIEARFAGREAELMDLLSALYVTTNDNTPAMLIHPEGPLGTARSAMLIADVTQGLQSKADSLRAELQEVTILNELQKAAADDMGAGLSALQEARAELSQAISERRDLPRRFVDDTVQKSLLIANARTLDSFADNVKRLARDEQTGLDFAPITAKGDLPWPVLGRILRQPGQPDAAGITRPGVIFATRDEAVVTSPMVATVRFAGEFSDYGNVVILEPKENVLFLFVGLDTIFAEIGTVLPKGSPLGLMGRSRGNDLGGIDNGITSGETPLTQTLYFEVRENKRAVDPFKWMKKGTG